MKSVVPIVLVASGLMSAAPPKVRQVEVIATDYAFELPHELPPGSTTFHLRNDGKVYHEVAIALLKRGVTIDQLNQAAKEQKPLAPLTDGPVGILFAGPGKRSTTGLATELIAGRQYAVRCAFRDTVTAPRHFEMGMYSVINVRPSKTAPALPRIKADTIVATDYSFRYPRTLSPGRHTLVFRNEGKVQHELNVILPKKGVTFEQMFAVRLSGGNPRALNEEQLGVLVAAAGGAPLGRLDVNLLPGREYRIICVFRDDPKAPPHFELGMYGSIQVTGKPRG